MLDVGTKDTPLLYLAQCINVFINKYLASLQGGLEKMTIGSRLTIDFFKVMLL